MLNVTQAAHRAHRNPETIRRWIREGKLTAWKVGNQHVIDEDDLTNTLRDGGPPRRGQRGIIEDPLDRVIVSAIHQGRAERMAQIAEATAPYLGGSWAGAASAPVDWLPRIVGRIVRAVDPARIVLFGSRARGDARPDSDYDLMVVLDQVTDRRASRIDVRGSFMDLPVAADVLIATTDEVDGRFEGRLTGAAYWAATEGRVVYDRDRA